MRILVNDDNLLKDGATGAFSKYNKDQFTPISLTDNAEDKALVTEFGDLGRNRRRLFVICELCRLYSLSFRLRPSLPTVVNSLFVCVFVSAELCH